jgi:hypothetical protein
VYPRVYVLVFVRVYALSAGQEENPQTQTPSRARKHQLNSSRKDFHKICYHQLASLGYGFQGLYIKVWDLGLEVLSTSQPFGSV